MIRRLIVLGIALTLISTLAAVAAIQSSSEDAEAQVSAYPMRTLCLELTTNLYKGSFTGACPPNHLPLSLPDAYPLSLCASAYDSHLRAPYPNGQCPPATSIRFDLPTEVPIQVCYIWATGRLRLPTPYPNGGCGAGGFLVTFPFEAGADSYQTLGNMDIDVPASDGVLVNDEGPGLSVTGFDATSTFGGTVNVNPDGSFTYIPPPAGAGPFLGDDTFEYEVEDSGGVTEFVTVTIEVIAPTIWFVDADAADPGDGRRLTPLNNIQVLNNDGSDPDNPGDFIYLYESIAPNIGGLVLEDFQTLLSQDVDLAAIIESELGLDPILQGGVQAGIPPFVVFPPTDPTLDTASLTSTGVGLVMSEDTTAVGVTIASSGGPGVLATGAGNLLLDRTIVSGGFDGFTGSPGVDINQSEMVILQSEIRGGDGLAAAPVSDGGSSLQRYTTLGVDAGDGILIHDSNVDVDNSLVQGGNGAADPSSGGSGGDGIHGAFGALGVASSGSSLQGLIGPFQIEVNNSQVDGGNGGEGLGVTEGGGIGASSSLLGDDPPVVISFGGHGGAGINVFEASRPRDRSSSLQGPSVAPDVQLTVSMTGVSGGQAGNAVDFGGQGGPGISSGQADVVVDQASTVAGGGGGDALTQISGSGGHGIISGSQLLIPLSDRGVSLQGPGISDPGSLDVDSSIVTGGQAGIGTAQSVGIGGAGISASGSGIAEGLESDSSLAGLVENLQPVTVNASTISGADGADNVGNQGGLAGVGIQVAGADLLVQGGSLISGGEGGDGAPASPGARGIDIHVSPATIQTSTVNGGRGGTSENGLNPFGGSGIYFDGCNLCFTVTVTDTLVNGGDGGASLTPGAGLGGPGIEGNNDSLSVNISTVRAGNPGNDGSGRGGPDGTAAIVLNYFVSNAYLARFGGSTLIGSSGTSGQEPSLIVDAVSGTVCVDATGNTPTGSFDLFNNGGVLDISQASLAALSAANNGVTVNVTGAVGFNCVIPG